MMKKESSALEVAAILSRAASVSSSANDARLARCFDVTPQTLAGWRKRNTIPWEKLWDFCVRHDVSFDYVTAGTLVAPVEENAHYADAILLPRFGSLVSLEIGGEGGADVSMGWPEITWILDALVAYEEDRPESQHELRDLAEQLAKKIELERPDIRLMAQVVAPGHTARVIPSLQAKD